jgi:DNA-binding IclR family transcriptional regulator
LTALEERAGADGGQRGSAYRWPFRLITALVELGDGDHALGEIAKAMHVPATHASQVLNAGMSEHWVKRRRYGRYALHGPIASRQLRRSTANNRPQGEVAPAAGRGEVSAQLAALQRRTGGLVILHALLELVTPWHVHFACNDGGSDRLRALIDDEDLPSYLPLTQGAGGHAMIPWLDPRMALKLVAAPRHPGGVLLEPLAEPPEAIRDRGYAVTSGGQWTTLAAPLLGSAAVAGAVSVTVQAGSAPIDPTHLLQAADVLQGLLAYPASRGS